MDDPVDIRAWQRLDEQTTTSGKLEAGGVARRAAINLALDDHPEALTDEGALLASHGLSYTHIPVPFDAPSEAHFEAFRGALEESAGAAVHVHCIMNFRVSAFFYRLNRDYRGMPETQARALMQKQWAPDKTSDPRAAVWAQFIK
jgi:hypothetical protein